MILVSIVDIKANLSAYIERAAQGEQIVICRHNKPVAQLQPVTHVRSEPRPVGTIPGRPAFDVPASFFEPMEPDELERWEGAGAADPLSSLAKAVASRAAASRKKRGTAGRVRTRRR